MSGAGFHGALRLVLVSCFLVRTTGVPFGHDTPTQVFVADGNQAVLPCGLVSSEDLSQATTLEWLRVDAAPPRTLAVWRHSEELVKEQDPKYRGRTAVLQDGSLKLLAVQRQDTGTYRCVLRSSSLEKQAIVSLVVVQGSEVNFLLWRTAANQLFVLCWSSGWSPKPLVSVLDRTGSKVASVDELEVARQPDGLFSVRVRVNVEAVNGLGNKSVICRVEVPSQPLVREKMISITDDFSPQEAGSGHMLVGLLGFFVCLCVVVVLVTKHVAPHQRMGRMASLKGYGHTARLETGGASEDAASGLRGQEYGHMARLETGGASEDTARANGLRVQGTEASEILAENDLANMEEFKDSITSVGQKLGVEPALIAAIISRQSQAGTNLNSFGYGSTDPNCFGLMQINRHYHAVKGNPYSSEHIDQGVTFLIQLVKTMQRSRPDWSKEQQLKGALACYIAGEEKVLPLSYEDLDSVTPNRDFSSDVVARAHWFARNGF